MPKDGFGDRLGCALGGGGARGLAHIGVLKVLEERGIFPKFIAGTSMGALVGAMYATGLTASQLEQMALDMGWKRWAHLIDFSLIRPGGFIQGNRILSMLKSVLGDLKFSGLKLPFVCVATDICSGHEVVLSQGEVAVAVRASIAIPGIVTPVKVDGRYLVDGGLVNEVPVGLCRQLGAGYVIGVNVNPDPSKMTDQTCAKAPGFVEVLTQATLIAGYRLAMEDIRGADLAIHPEVGTIGFWQFHNAAEAIAIGERAARSALDGARGPREKSGLDTAG
jgi:NTE family protein